MPGFFDFINDFAEGGGGGGGGILGPLSDWAGNNSNALIGLGTGIAGAANGQGWGAGLQAGLQGFQNGRQTDQKQQQQQATYQYLLGRGLSPQYAQMMISNSSR